LRNDVEFHDGSRLVPEDVIASFALHNEPQSPAHGIMAQIEEIRAVGRRQIRFVLQDGNADFPFLLADPHLIIAPAARGFDGTGTGLYRLGRIEPGQRVLLNRVEAHYKDGRAGWFDRIEAQVIDSDAARVAALTLGRVDAVNGVAMEHRALVAGPWAGLGEDAAFRSLLREARSSFDSGALYGASVHCARKASTGKWWRAGRDATGRAPVFLCLASIPGNDGPRARFFVLESQ
jgi:ABC-type transport system substrate-binding protein